MSKATALLTILLLCSSVLAGDDVEQARKLRDLADEDWNAGRYAAAAEKLRQADSIYGKLPGEHLGDRAITLRALCWNLTKSGEAEESRVTWLRLCRLVSGKTEHYGEVWSGYVAVKEAIGTLAGLDAAIEFLEPVRRAATDHAYPKIAAQVLHDLAFHAADLGQDERAVPLLEKAIVERRKIRDLPGLAWSLNNLANSLVKLDRVEDALAPVREAFSLVHSKGIVEPQRSVEQRIEDILGKAKEREEAGKKLTAWLWEMGLLMAEQRRPMVVPADRVLRTAIALDPDPRKLERVVRLDLPRVPPEVKADLTIRAARAAAAHRRAGRWLDGVKCGKGPASPHLMARLLTAKALVRAARKDGKKFPAAAEAAAGAWRDLGDRAGREAALEDLVAAAKGLEVEDELEEIVEEYEELRQSGSPGGAGSSATSGGDRTGFDDLKVHDPLFRVSLVEGKIEIRDLVADRKVAVAVAWAPRNRSLNGLAIRIFGGYVSIESLSYGGAAVASGSPGTIRLDELGSCFPVPAQGALLITKNGAVHYELR